jgi:hypothetical protein
MKFEAKLKGKFGHVNTSAGQLIMTITYTLGLFS